MNLLKTYFAEYHATMNFVYVRTAKGRKTIGDNSGEFDLFNCRTESERQYRIVRLAFRVLADFANHDIARRCYEDFAKEVISKITTKDWQIHGQDIAARYPEEFEKYETEILLEVLDSLGK